MDSMNTYDSDSEADNFESETDKSSTETDISKRVSGQKKSRKRVGRVNLEQELRILECVEENPTLLTKRFTKLLSRQQYLKEWAEITEELNAMSNQKNSRTSEKWQKVLTRWITNTKEKLANIKRCKKTTGRGNYSNANISLTELEDRLLAIKGKSCVFGDGVTKEIGLSESDTDADLEEMVPVRAAVINEIPQISALENQKVTNIIKEQHREQLEVLKEVSSTLGNLLSLTRERLEVLQQAVRGSESNS